MTLHAIVHALSITGSMTWEITWALILGFALSAVLVVRFARTGGGMMLKMMGGPPEQPDEMSQHSGPAVSPPSARPRMPPSRRRHTPGNRT